MIEKLYTVEEVAELASVTGRTIRNYLKSGRLVGRKIGGQWRFPESEVQRLLTGGAPPPEVNEDEEGSLLDIDEDEDLATEEKPAYNDELPYTAGVFENRGINSGAAGGEYADDMPPAGAPQPAPATASQTPGPTALPHTPPGPSPQTAPAAAPHYPQAAGGPPVPPQAYAPGYPYPGGGQMPMYAQAPQAPMEGGPYGVPPYPQAPVQAPQGGNPYSFEQPLVSQPYGAYNPAAMNPALYGAAYPYPPMQNMPGAAGPHNPENPAPPPQQEAQGDDPSKKTSSQKSQWDELSDVGKRVAQFVSEVHDCSEGPHICTIVDMHQSLASAKITSERLNEIAQEESEKGPSCRSFVEFDARYYIARYTLFGTSSFLSRCLMLIG